VRAEFIKTIVFSRP